MTKTPALPSAEQLTSTNTAHFPNESSQYRAARNALLIEEIKLRRQIEQVAMQRRALPPGGEVPQPLEFISESGLTGFSGLFGDRDTLLVYSMMYGPQRKSPCPMCTSLLSAWNGIALNLRDRAAIAVTARAEIGRLIEYKTQRGLANLPFFSDTSGAYTRAYVSADDADIPGFSVFSRRDGIIRHFYSGEMSGKMADPGQDPRGAPDLDPLWLALDWTPEGRGTDWHPKLSY